MLRMMTHSMITRKHKIRALLAERKWVQQMVIALKNNIKFMIDQTFILKKIKNNNTCNQDRVLLNLNKVNTEERAIQAISIKEEDMKWLVNPLWIPKGIKSNHKHQISIVSTLLQVDIINSSRSQIVVEKWDLLLRWNHFADFLIWHSLK